MPLVSFNELSKLKFNLAPSQLIILDTLNKNTISVKDFLDRDLKFTDNGYEVGSINYISASTHYFIRAKALQNDYFIPNISADSAVPIRPQVFINHNLKEGDLLISKDSNIGEAVILDKDYPYHTISGALYKLPVTKRKYYLFAFLKHRYFLSQLDLLVPKGSTIRHAKTLFLQCKIPLPNQKNSEEIIEYVEKLTQAIINKEKLIRIKHQKILEVIEGELLENQKANDFIYKESSYNKIALAKRLDTGLYNYNFQKNLHLVKNYKFESSNLYEKGFKANRGTSLEIKGLGTRVDSNEHKDGYYELVLPTNISEYGTVKYSSYIGTKKKLKTIKKGDIIFGGEGFKKGRSLVVCNEVSNIATNYHAIRIHKEHFTLTESIFVRCFLSYWREKGMIDYIGVGGSGGHCAPEYFDLIEIPNFPENKQIEISNLYHRPTLKSSNLNLKNFLEKDCEWNQEAGILELDESAKQYKKILNKILDDIVNDIDVEIIF